MMAFSRPRLLLTIVLVLIARLSAPPAVLGQQTSTITHWDSVLSPPGKALQLAFRYSKHELYHSSEPWQTLDHLIRGTIQISGDQWTQFDTLTARTRLLPAVHQLNFQGLALIDYGDTAQSSVSPKDHYTELLGTAAYTPNYLFHFAALHPEQCTVNRATRGALVISLPIGDAKVTFHFSAADSAVTMIEVLENDDLYGDVWSRFHYYDATRIDGAPIAQRVEVERFNGKVHDTIEVLPNALLPAQIPTPLSAVVQRPGKTSDTVAPSAVFKRYNDHVAFVELPHVAARALVIAFSDHVVVTTAPLNSKNGELIVDEVQRAFPNKPIKYFLVGHSCPWGIGGLRAFVHVGSTILCGSTDMEYVSYLTSNPHYLNPDRLERDPRPLNTSPIQDSMTLTDGSYTLKIYHIGARSGHTADYMVAYLPQEKLLWNDDLVFIPESGKLTKANKGQEGLYNAIKDLGLEVDTVLQSWPISGRGAKTTIPFQELEASVKMQR